MYVLVLLKGSLIEGDTMNTFIYSGNMFPNWNRHVKDKLSELPICANCEWHGVIEKNKAELLVHEHYTDRLLEMIGSRSVLKSLYIDLINYPDRCFHTTRCCGFMRSLFGLACDNVRAIDMLSGEFTVCKYFRRKDVL